MRRLSDICQNKTLNLLRLISILLLSTPLAAEESTDTINAIARISEWKVFNLNTVNHYIIPAYQTLSTKAQALRQSTENLCQQPNQIPHSLASTRLAFHDTMDAWQFIQNIQFGPIQNLMRNYSMQFWPDKKNHVGKHLDQLLQNQELNALSDSEFHKASVSIKGLPAIERFLFDEDKIKALQSEPFHCQVLVRIANYTAQSSKELTSEWQDMLSQFSDTTQHGTYFEDDIDATTTLLKTLVEPIEVIRDLKLLRPLGSEFGQQKPRRLESWRSERSLRNIQINIESLYAFYQGKIAKQTVLNTGLRDLLDTEDAKAIEQLFIQNLSLIKEIPTPIEHTIESKDVYHQLQNLSLSLKALHELLENTVSKQGIHLGFNSRDGD